MFHFSGVKSNEIGRYTLMLIRNTVVLFICQCLKPKIVVKMCEK